MSTKKRHYVAVYGDTELAFDLESWADARYALDIRIKCTECLRAANEYNTPDDPDRQVVVNVFELTIEKGELKRALRHKEPTQPPPRRMNEAEFQAAQAKALAELPPEFHGFVSAQAWEHGHSSGYEEVMLYVNEYVAELRRPIKLYTHRLRQVAESEVDVY